MKNSYNGKAIPSEGKPIGFSGGELQVPDTPIIPFIEGDGTGRDIWKASRRVFDAAVEQAYGGNRRVAWFEVFAGEKAFNAFKEWLPDDTVAAIRDFRVAIKGPLTTPVGGGIRSLNVALRQILDLYSCERPVRYFAGVPSPVREPEKMNVFIFRENTEDVYIGIEWKSGSPEAKKLLEFLNNEMLKEGKKQTLDAIYKTHGKGQWKQKLMINDRIADSVFQQVLLRPDEYSVLATSNLNGDYLSDACAAQVGGLGMAPGSNIGDGFGVFEATHGTAPKYADKDVINPSSVMLSGAMMFEFLGWSEAAKLIEDGIARTIQQKRVTYDLERLMPGATKVGTSAFASAIIENMAGHAVAR